MAPPRGAVQEQLDQGRGAGPAADWHRAGPPGGAPRGPYRGPDRGTVIDADYVVIDDDAAPPPPRPSGRPQPPSGWTRH